MVIYDNHFVGSCYIYILQLNERMNESALPPPTPPLRFP